MENEFTIAFSWASKKVFSPYGGVEPSYQVLDILEYDCGLILSLALISTENPNFEIASIYFSKDRAFDLSMHAV
jgi:hypothetical protein